MEKLNKRKKKPMKYKMFFRITSIILVVISVVFLLMLFKVDVLSTKYMIYAILGIIVIDFCLIFVMNRRFKVLIKIPFLILAIILSLGLTFGIYNLNLAANFVEAIVGDTLKEEKYNLYVLNEKDYSGIKDLNKTKLGVFDNSNESLEKALKLLKKKVTFKSETSYDDLEKILDDCLEKKIDVIFMSSSIAALTEEQYPEKFKELKSIDEIVVSTEETIKKNDVDVTKEPFLIYISGIDTYGSIGTVSRSDVNILAAVNPKTGKVLLVNTPRDYYVKLHSKKAMDKLTHAGIYGVEESMNTLADLYVTDVDFYLKVNFSSLIKIVDALGGITVNSKYNFSYDGYTFKKGPNKLNGNATLAFSRCRKELPGGDVSRGENQEAVIEAIIAKAISPSIISRYTSIIKTMKSSFVTNMSEVDIYSLAKFQLSSGTKWSIESKNVTGSNSYQTTYSAGKTKLYVMLPDEQSVTDVKLKLNEILEEN